MRHTKIFVGVGLLLLAAAVSAQDTGGIVNSYSFWFGGHYIDTSDYSKKVGEYRWIEEDVWPEFGLTFKSSSPNSIFYFDGRYLDKQNVTGLVTTKTSDRFAGKFRFRSLTRQTGQDLLANIEAREYLPTTSSPGGKMLTHDIQDVGADYSYERKEVLSQVSMLLSRQNDVRVKLAHRAIMKQGTEQVVANSHCFSCHLTSQGAKIDESTQDLKAGIEADVSRLKVGYDFGYRLYESSAPTPQAYYDDAKHPTLGTSGAEFGSRLNYDDVTVPIDAKPKTEKTSHKVRMKGDAGKGRFASSFSYTKALNKFNDLASESWGGAFNYAVTMSPKTRFVAKVAATGISADDPFVDVATHREGKPNAASFDFDRYSSLDRTTADVTAEVIHRLNPKATLSVLAGYNRVARKDYPIVDDGTTSGTFTGQAKLRYRQGLKSTTSLKYRFEKTSDPFVSGRGLFEAPGVDGLEPILYGFNPAGDSLWGYFYYMREDLRYQDITTEPTDFHEVQLSSTYRPSSKTSLNLKVTGQMDKNGDLDSLDVKHTKANGTLSFTFMPDTKWMLTGGGGYRYEKSRGPVTVALFDG